MLLISSLQVLGISAIGFHTIDSIQTRERLNQIDSKLNQLNDMSSEGGLTDDWIQTRRRLDQLESTIGQLNDIASEGGFTVSLRGVLLLSLKNFGKARSTFGIK